MTHPSMTAIVEALAPFAGGPGTPFPKPEDFRRAADALKTAPALDEYVRGLEEKAAALELVREEAAKSNVPLGRSDSLALDRIRTVLGLPLGGKP